LHPGVTIGEGAVVAARSVVVKNVGPWAVVGGNPAKFLKMRVLGDGGQKRVETVREAAIPRPVRKPPEST